MNIEEAAEKYIENIELYKGSAKRGFKAGALSDAAKQYWFEQFRNEEMARIKSVIDSMPSDADLMEDSKI
jgi:hypothetical protein